MGSRFQAPAREGVAARLPGAEPSGLVVSGLSKSFGETAALASADLRVLPGTVHTVAGENGSGKSTLVKILSGILAPDSGTVSVGGRAVPRFSPGHAGAAGIAPVLQEVLVAESRSVLENVWLGYDGFIRRRVAKDVRREKAGAVLSRLCAEPPDLDVPVGTMPLAQRQSIVIARAIVRSPAVLILDEATAALDVGDRERLFEVVRELVADGCAVVFISHRMDEVVALSDAVTVLRSGRVAGHLDRAEVTATAVLKLMSPHLDLGERA
jgi:ABC-type sugar transport system ATPase subunit